MMRTSRRPDGPIGPSIALAFCLLASAGIATAQTPPTEAKAPSVDEQLRRQNEIIQAQNEAIKLLSEQNKRLGEKLDALSKRLDGMATPPPVAAPPDAGPTPPVPVTVGPKRDSAGPAADASRTAYAPQTPPADEIADVPDDSIETGAKTSDSDGLYDSLHDGQPYGFRSLFDSLHPEKSKGKHWYEKLSLRGYSQVRFGKSLYHSGEAPSLFGDAAINGRAEDFSIRRARLILSGDISDRTALYFQMDFANTPPGSTGTAYYSQLRDLYVDIHLDDDNVNRFRVGQSKIPYGFEVMQSSGNRAPLDRSDAIDSGTTPNQRDLGVFYYWTPVEKQKLLMDLVDGGLKGSGNYGVFALGTYNGQGGSLLEKNLSPYIISRLTWPFRLDNGQVIEASIQGYAGRYVVTGGKIPPLGVGPARVPVNADGNIGLLDERIAATFVYYPQPWGFQAEWNVGRGPGLNDAQTAIESRRINGGYAMAMYKLDTKKRGIFIPYARYQYYLGGYRNLVNAPYGSHSQYDLGVEWQIRKELELVTEYSFVDGIDLDTINQAGVIPYGPFSAGIFRMQLQFNY